MNRYLNPANRAALAMAFMVVSGVSCAPVQGTLGTDDGLPPLIMNAADKAACYNIGNTPANLDLDGDKFGQSRCVEKLSDWPAEVVLEGDCNDGDVYVHPYAAEVCANGKDDDCDGLIDEGGCIVPNKACASDHDGDLYAAGMTMSAGTDCNGSGEVTTSLGNDCNDTVPTTHPGASDTTVDGVDQDCSGIDGNGSGTGTYTFYRDADGDTYGYLWQTTTSNTNTPPAGYVSNSTDCNDAVYSIHPGAAEQCNGLDDDCDAQIDDGVSNTTWYYDSDHDNYGSSNMTTVACLAPANYVAMSGDCNDGNAAVHPYATETCNSVDDDCDGSVDEGAASVTWYRDADLDGYGTSTATMVVCTQPYGYVLDHTDCNDGVSTIHPNATETCNSVDDDCDAQIDEGGSTTWYRDNDGDQYGSATLGTMAACSQPAGYVSSNTDCNDLNAGIKPGAAETCNSADDDCDGTVDEGLAVNTYYRDVDGDGYAASGAGTTTGCALPSGYATQSGDCNDNNSAIKPGASDTSADGIDQDCNGVDGNSTSRTPYTWTFTLDSSMTNTALDKFEVRNLTSGEVVTNFVKSGVYITITLNTRKDDKLSTQCWYNNYTGWCADNNHSGKIASATGPTGSYTAGKTSGDLVYGTVYDGTPRYEGLVK